MFPSPAYPTSPSPDPFPLLLSRSVVFRTILSGNDAKCCPQVTEQISNPQPLLYSQYVARWSVFILEECLLWGSFGLCEVEMDLSVSLVDYFPVFPSSPVAC